MADLFTSVGTALTSIFSQVDTVITKITGNEILSLFCLVLPIVGIGIGMLKRLLRVRA